MAGVLIVGCGGGGAATVSQMRAQYDAPSLTINASDADVAIDLPPGIQAPEAEGDAPGSFKGRKGAAYSATMAARDEIVARISGFRTVIAVATLSGGAGFGAMFALSQMCRETGADFVAAVVLPFEFEAERRPRAEAELSEVAKFADRAVVLDLQTLQGMEDGMSLRMLIGAGDLLLSKAVRALASAADRVPLLSVFRERAYTFSYGFEPDFAESALAAVRQPMYATDAAGKIVVVCADSEVSADRLEEASAAVAGFTGVVPETVRGTGPGDQGATVFIPISVRGV